jgi:hypothetical protein
MASSEMLRRVALVRNDVSEELSASFIRMTRIGKLETTLAVTSNRHTLRRNTKEALSSSETSVLTRATRRNIPEDAILHSHCREKPQVLHRKHNDCCSIIFVILNSTISKLCKTYRYRRVPGNSPLYQINYW